MRMGVVVVGEVWQVQEYVLEAEGGKEVLDTLFWVSKSVERVKRFGVDDVR